MTQTSAQAVSASRGVESSSVGIGYMSPELVTGNLLLEMAQAQRALLRQSRFAEFRGKTNRDFFSTFQQDPLFADVVLSARGELETDITEGEFKRLFGAAILEKMAYVFLSSRGDGRIIILGEDTAKLIKTLYSREGNVHRAFNLSGLAVAGIGYYMPDGLEVEFINGEPKVIGILEYSVSSAETKPDFGAQKKGFVSLSRRLANFAKAPNFVYVSPMLNTKPCYDPDPDVEHVYLPFTGHELHQFRDRIYYEYRPAPELPPLVELRQLSQQRNSS